MDIDAIRQDWEALAGRRTSFTEAFYRRLFDRHPHYRSLFPEAMEAQMEHMVEMFSSIARFADRADVVRPYLVNVGFAHRKMGIHAPDVENFKRAFIDTLAEVQGERWNEASARAWNEAFDDMIVPLFDEGLDNGRAAPGE